jgi:hypothetical protein
MKIIYVFSYVRDGYAMCLCVYMYERMYVRNVGRYVSTVCTFGVRMYMLACLRMYVCIMCVCTYVGM